MTWTTPHHRQGAPVRMLRNILVFVAVRQTVGGVHRSHGVATAVAARARPLHPCTEQHQFGLGRTPIASEPSMIPTGGHPDSAQGATRIPQVRWSRTKQTMAAARDHDKAQARSDGRGLPRGSSPGPRHGRGWSHPVSKPIRVCSVVPDCRASVAGPTMVLHVGQGVERGGCTTGSGTASHRTDGRKGPAGSGERDWRRSKRGPHRFARRSADVVSGAVLYRWSAGS